MAVVVFQKGQSVRLSKHFTTACFDCKCSDPNCVYTLVDSDLTAGLELLWEKVGIFSVSSGFRCSIHNKAIGGKPGSMHMVGKAADCHPEVSVSTLYFAADSIPVFHNGGIGRYDTQGFCHLDVRGSKSRWEG